MTWTSALVVFVLQMSSAQGTTPGRVVGAPHGGYDQHSEAMARNVADRLGWGCVRAIGYRSVPYRTWYDVNRPTERIWSGGGFGDDLETSAAEQVYEDYQQRLRRAAQRSGALEMLVEVHGHSRSVQAGGRTVRLQVIEVATVGLSADALRRLKARYEQLQAQLPAERRVTLAFDALDDHYAYRGLWVPFFFRASGAKQSGSLRASQVRRALHFELPPAVRETSLMRATYERIIAELAAEAADL